MKAYTPFAVVLILFTFLAFFPVTMNNGNFWDGCWYFPTQEKGFQEIYNLSVIAGYPQQAYWGLVISWFGSNSGMHLAGVLLALGGAFFVYLVFAELSFVSREQAAWIAILSTLNPVSTLVVCKVYSANLVSHTLFWIGAYLHRRVHQSKREVWRILLFWITAWCLFFLSAMWPAIIPMFGVYVFLVFVDSLFHSQGGWLKKNLAFVYSHIDVILGPFLIYQLCFYLFPPQEAFVSGYSLKFSEATSTLWAHYAYVWTLCQRAYEMGYKNPVLAFSLPVILFFISRRMNPDWESKVTAQKSLLIVAVSVVIFNIAIFAFVATGKAPILDNWEMRNALTHGVPIACFLCGVGSLFFRDWQRHFFTLVAAGLILVCWDQGTRFLFRWSQDRAASAAIVKEKDDFEKIRWLSIDWTENFTGYNWYWLSEWFEIFAHANTRPPLLMYYSARNSNWHNVHMYDWWDKNHCHLNLAFKPKISLDQTWTTIVPALLHKDDDQLRELWGIEVSKTNCDNTALKLLNTPEVDCVPEFLTALPANKPIRVLEAYSYFKCQGKGWSLREYDGIWTIGQSSILPTLHFSDAKRNMQICLTAESNFWEEPIHVSLVANEQIIGEILVADRREQEHCFVFINDPIKEDIMFEMRVQNPPDFRKHLKLRIGEMRPLGLLVKKVTLR